MTAMKPRTKKILWFLVIVAGFIGIIGSMAIRSNSLLVVDLLIVSCMVCFGGIIEFVYQFYK
jgi:hypothetical protein